MRTGIILVLTGSLLGVLYVVWHLWRITPGGWVAKLVVAGLFLLWMAASFAESTKSCSLSPGWLRNSHQLVVRADSGINRKNALKGKTVGITDATSMAALKNAELDKKISSVWYYDDLSDCFSALAAGDCDAVVIDSIVAGYYI